MPKVPVKPAGTPGMSFVTVRLPNSGGFSTSGLVTVTCAVPSDGIVAGLPSMSTVPHVIAVSRSRPIGLGDGALGAGRDVIDGDRSRIREGDRLVERAVLTAVDVDVEAAA